MPDTGLSQLFSLNPKSGAASSIGLLRQTNHRSVTAWMNRVMAGQSPVAESEELTPEQAARERRQPPAGRGRQCG